MDLEDNETTMASVDGQVEELKGTIALLESQLSQNQIQMSDMEARLEESKAQVGLTFAKKLATLKSFIVAEE